MSLKTEYIAFRATEQQRVAIKEVAERRKVTMSAVVLSLVDGMISGQQKTATKGLENTGSGLEVSN